MVRLRNSLNQISDRLRVILISSSKCLKLLGRQLCPTQNCICADVSNIHLLLYPSIQKQFPNKFVGRLGIPSTDSNFLRYFDEIRYNKMFRCEEERFEKWLVSHYFFDHFPYNLLFWIVTAEWCRVFNGGPEHTTAFFTC